MTQPSAVISPDERPLPEQDAVAIRLVDVVAGYGDTVALDHSRLLRVRLSMTC